jgi:hypothetical protein
MRQPAEGAGNEKVFYIMIVQISKDAWVALYRTALQYLFDFGTHTYILLDFRSE